MQTDDVADFDENIDPFKHDMEKCDKCKCQKTTCILGLLKTKLPLWMEQIAVESPDGKQKNVWAQVAPATHRQKNCFTVGCALCFNWANDPLHGARAPSTKWSRFEIKPSHECQCKNHAQTKKHEAAVKHHFKLPILQVKTVTNICGKGGLKKKLSFGKGVPTLRDWKRLVSAVHSSVTPQGHVNTQ